MTPHRSAFGGYADINGLRLYHEIHGQGFPLVLLHGGGSTIASNYGRILPRLAQHHRVIAVELQAHGHTRDIDRPLSFEQDADDVAALLAQLGVDSADFMGFSNGGTTCLQIAIRHPGRVRRLVLASALARRDGMQPGFFDGFEGATSDQVPEPLAEAFLEANPDRDALRTMFERDVARMQAFEDIDDEALRGIRAPTLVINGDRDVVRTEHALALSKTIPDARLAILPSGHGDYLGEICAPDPHGPMTAVTVALIDSFLET